MIAPLRPPLRPSSPHSSSTLREARRLVADRLLPRAAQTAPSAVPAWKAWLAASWMVMVAVAFVVCWWWWARRG